jgi:hypothetical protein
VEDPDRSWPRFKTDNASSWYINVERRSDEALLLACAERYFPAGGGSTMALRARIFTNTPDEHFILDGNLNPLAVDPFRVVRRQEHQSKTCVSLPSKCI